MIELLSRIFGLLLDRAVRKAEEAELKKQAALETSRRALQSELEAAERREATARKGLN